MDPLPYRTDPDDLRRFVAAKARGRTLAQIRTLNFSTKSFEGTAAAVEALGLAEDRNGDLSAIGRRFALADGDERAPALRALLRRFAPYALLVEAVLVEGGPAPTPLHWIETWWAAHGFGSSESNRAEAASVLAKVIEGAGLGTFVQGRKGKASRIEWTDEAPSLLTTPAAAAVSGSRSEGRPLLARHGTPPSGAEDDMAKRGPRSAPAEPGSAPHPRIGPLQDTDSIAWELSPGRAVEIRLPRRLTPGESARLRRLLDVLLGD